MSVITITTNNFEQEVSKSDIPVLLDFWAQWCGHCQMSSPIVEEFANELQGKVKVGKVNVDEEAKIAEGFNITAIPTFVVINNGKLIEQTVGAKSKQEILEILKKVVQKYNNI